MTEEDVAKMSSAIYTYKSAVNSLERFREIKKENKRVTVYATAANIVPGTRDHLVFSNVMEQDIADEFEKFLVKCVENAYEVLKSYDIVIRT